MITKQSGFWIASCDRCCYEEKFSVDEYDWADVVAEIKYDGWKAKKTEQGWRNECPDCQYED